MEEKAMFAAGCFWGVEALFRKTPGVIDTSVGYSGGSPDITNHKDVCSGAGGHAEVVSICFDPETISYENLLKVFWEGHDPTQLNRQGPDEGIQFRSAIYYMSSIQKYAAEKSRDALDASAKFDKPIVTEIEKAAQFHMADDHHQQYLERQGLESCHTR